MEKEKKKRQKGISHFVVRSHFFPLEMRHFFLVQNVNFSKSSSFLSNEAQKMTLLPCSRHAFKRNIVKKITFVI